ncbi:MAG: hypothetical protein ACTSRP_24845 [Candidatus Helarchaeota archaeon]
MIESEEELDWNVQKNMNVWKDKKKHQQTLEELFNGNVRYLKFIRERLGEDAVLDGFKATVEFTYKKNMGGMEKMAAVILKTISRKILMKMIINAYYINMQHIVDLKCIKRLEHKDGVTEIEIEKCTAKRVWNIGLRNNGVKDVFSPEDYCKHSCIPTLKRILEVVEVEIEVDFSKKGCRQIIKLKKKGQKEE